MGNSQSSLEQKLRQEFPSSTTADIRKIVKIYSEPDARVILSRQREEGLAQSLVGHYSHMSYEQLLKAAKGWTTVLQVQNKIVQDPSYTYCSDIALLARSFPEVPTEYISDVLRQSCGNIDSAAETLAQPKLYSSVITQPSKNDDDWQIAESSQMSFQVPDPTTQRSPIVAQWYRLAKLVNDLRTKQGCTTLLWHVDLASAALQCSKQNAEGFVRAPDLPEFQQVFNYQFLSGAAQVTPFSAYEVVEAWKNQMSVLCDTYTYIGVGVFHSDLLHFSLILVNAI